MYTARSLIRRVPLLIVAFTLIASVSAPALAQATARAAQVTPSDRWLEKLNAKHMLLFDSPAPAGGIALIHAMNYYDTYNKTYGVQDKDIRGVITFYGSATFHAVNDAMWSKYAIGEFMQVEDAVTNAPAVANPWREKPVILGFTLPGASVESLQKRGAVFILCNNALEILSGMLAQARGLDAAVVYQDLKSNILPGVELVPAMVIALEQAHKAGLAYQRQ
jgi:intracellular sulfur oxidation DsrE/DsrF family protein